MNQPDHTVKCPLCGEPIPADAIQCRSCQANLLGPDGRKISLTSSVGAILAANQPKTEGSGLGKALLAGLFWPGLGSWNLGGRVRGGAIFLAITLCIIFSVLAYVAGINNEIADAMHEASANGLLERIAVAGNGWWGTLSFLVYFYSFFDVYLLFRAKNQPA